jgi:protein SCO1/2
MLASSMRRVVAAVVAPLLALLLAACQPPAFKAVDITGASYAQGFALDNAQGKRTTLADFKGKAVVVFFGFTQCPDVCPTTLGDLAEVKKRLGAAGEQVQVVFITLDPERDTPAVLGEYVPQFDPSFVGLRGSAEQTAATAKDFKIFYAKVAGKTPTTYTLDHTAGAYVFDKDGRVRLFVRHGTPVDDVVADLRRLL